MAIRDLTSERLFVDERPCRGRDTGAHQPQAHYLTTVLRLRTGAEVLVFNGRDGEWVASLAEINKRGAVLRLERQVRPQEGGPDIEYLFAPLKRSRLDYMVQKATEMGVRRLRPVITERTIAERVNTERMRANVIEAAEQCGILRVPEVDEPVRLDRVLDDWNEARRIVYCDEQDEMCNPIENSREAFPWTPGGSRWSGRRIFAGRA